MKIFVIVVTYNGMMNDWISKCLLSLQNSSIKVQTIVVDNNSSDATVNFIAENFPEILIIESKTNLGFGGANNLGLKKALELHGDYFFLLNQDAYVDHTTIEKLINISQSNPEYAVISPVHLNGKGDALDKSFGRSISPYYCKGLYEDYFLEKRKKEIYEAEFICAAAWLLPKKTLKLIGGFSPAFFHYGEDDNYCHRVHYYNMKIGVVPNTYIYHDREDRPKSIYDERIISMQRQYTLWCSNPTKHIDITTLLSQYRNKMLKYVLTGNFGEAKNSKKIHTFLKENKQIIVDSYNQSITNKSYKFII